MTQRSEELFRFLFCVCVCYWHVCIHHMCTCCLSCPKEHQSPWSWTYRWSANMWVLGPKLESITGSSSAPSFGLQASFVETVPFLRCSLSLEMLGFQQAPEPSPVLQPWPFKHSLKGSCGLPFSACPTHRITPVPFHLTTYPAYPWGTAL